MVVQLAAQLEVPLRERNDLLLAAGYAPLYGQRGLEEPEMGPVRETLDLVLSSHEPYPAMVGARHWGIIAANEAVSLLTEGAAPELLEPPANVLRLAFTPTASRLASSTWLSCGAGSCSGSADKRQPLRRRTLP